MKLSFSKLVKQIEASNEEFNKMSNKNKRVQIARDCLKRLEVKNISCVNGIFLDYQDDSINGESYKDIVNTFNCEVCAKGGLFASYIGRVNNLLIDVTDENSGARWDTAGMQKLSEIFTRKQLDGIEVAFEQQSYNWTKIQDDIFLENCIHYVSYIDCPKIENEYGDETYDPNLLFTSICKNIIKNKGEFVPTDYVKPNAKIN